MKIDWTRIRNEFNENPKRFYRFWWWGFVGILAAFLIFWMWNDPPSEPGAAGRAFAGVLAVSIAAPPIVWLIRVGKSD
jgi:putative flippase GtrA